MKWITRERPKIDRIACPWLIRRFVDPDAEFLYVPPQQVKAEAQRLGAIPYDVPGVELTHDGPLCSFDAILKKYRLEDPALQRLSVIVRAADTDTLGLSATIRDDHEMLAVGLRIYEALYVWCRDLVAERHGWYPEQIPTA